MMYGLYEKEHLYHSKLYSCNDIYIGFESYNLKLLNKYHHYNPYKFCNPDIIDEINNHIRYNGELIKKISLQNVKLIKLALSSNYDSQRIGLHQMLEQSKWDVNYQIFDELKKENDDNLKQFNYMNIKELIEDRERYRQKSIENGRLLREALVNLANERMPKKLTENSKEFRKIVNKKKRNKKK